MGSCGGLEMLTGGGQTPSSDLHHRLPPGLSPLQPGWGPGGASSAPAGFSVGRGGAGGARPAPTRVRPPPCSALRSAALPAGTAPS